MTVEGWLHTIEGEVSRFLLAVMRNSIPPRKGEEGEGKKKRRALDDKYKVDKITTTGGRSRVPSLGGLCFRSEEKVSTQGRRKAKE
jgi:hypothetical protein